MVFVNILARPFCGGFNGWSSLVRRSPIVGSQRSVSRMTCFHQDGLSQFTCHHRVEACSEGPCLGLAPASALVAPSDGGNVDCPVDPVDAEPLGAADARDFRSVQPSCLEHGLSDVVECVESGGNARTQRYHRLAEVRAEQGVSMRSMARRLGIDAQQLRQQESPDCDLRLSELHRWQAALEVPLVDLLVEPQEDFACPVQQRAQLLKIMKTAMAIMELATSPRVARLAQMLREQLVTLMPELEHVSAWPNYGGRRPADELGKTLEHPVSTRDLVSDGGFE